MTGSSQNFFRVRMYSQTQIRIPFLPSLRSLVRAKPTDCAGFNTRTTSGLRNHSVVSGRFRWRFSETKNDVYSRVKRSLCAAATMRPPSNGADDGVIGHQPLERFRGVLAVAIGVMQMENVLACAKFTV